MTMTDIYKKDITQRVLSTPGTLQQLLLAALLLLFSTSLRAQQVTEAKSLPGELVISYEVPLTKPHSDYAHVVTPLLCSPTDTLRLEPVIIRGARNARALHRDHVLRHKGQEPPYIRAAAMQPTVSGSKRISLAAYPWARKSPLTLCVLTEREGCCSVETVSRICGDTFRYRIPLKPVFHDVDDNTGQAGLLQRDNPVLEHISNYRPYDHSRVLSKEKGALYVHFPLDKSELLRDYRNNADILDRIVDITRQILADSTSTVRKFQIIGLASVEGSVKHNDELAGNRAKALRDYIQSRVSAPESIYEVVNGGEAWAELRDQVSDARFEGRDEVLSIIDNEPDADRREQLIRKVNKGNAYSYIKNYILADQRNAGYIRIYWDYVPDHGAEVINRASALLRQEKYAEALALLQGVKDDVRALNALGVALYMTGSDDEAVQCFRRAAQAGNADAQQNLQQLQD